MTIIINAHACLICAQPREAADLTCGRAACAEELANPFKTTDAVLDFHEKVADLVLADAALSLPLRKVVTKMNARMLGATGRLAGDPKVAARATAISQRLTMAADAIVADEEVGNAELVTWFRGRATCQGVK